MSPTQFVCVKLRLYDNSLLGVIGLLNPQLTLKQFLVIQGDSLGPVTQFSFKNSKTRLTTGCWLSLLKRKPGSFLSRVNRITMEPSNFSARCESKELKTGVQIKTCTGMYIAVFTVSKRWKQPRCPSVAEWVNQMHTVRWNIARLERSGVLSGAAVRADVERRPSGRSQTLRAT